MRRYTRALIAAGCVILAAVVIGLLPTALPSRGNLVVPEGTHRRPVGPLAEGRIVTQQSVAEGTDLQSVGMLFATFQRVNHGTLHIAVSAEMDGQWRELATTAVDETTLQDNATYTLPLPAPVHVGRGTRLRIELRSDGPINEAITWWENPDWTRAGYLLTYNGQAQGGTTIFQMSYRPEPGRLFMQVGAMWRQSTVFLTPFWKVILLGALAITLGGMVVAIRRPLGED